MFDEVIKYGNSKIQHGKHSDRIYLMKLDDADVGSIINKLDKLTEEHKYGKIFTKIPKKHFEIFLNDGFEKEAEIPKFYNGENDCVFMSKFPVEKRGVIQADIKKRLNDVLTVCKEKEQLTKEPKISDEFEYKILKHEDAKQLTELYKVVFASYPFPIYDENYLKETMDDNIIYFGIFYKGKLVSASSAEMDFDGENVEMTDFATLPDFRGNNFAQFLLYQMENEVIKKGIKTFFTIARGVSFGMNITFAKLGYKYGGTLINNTNISGNIENMNIWYKE
ncbi:MAG: putative beta-lysine N-acetyltransferase [Candidatus Marinimicrobia bacterium]|nr:putative beta-lysine N-acetyltransferase [Candidatus Neomarinimicrobiota bacterium]